MEVAHHLVMSSDSKLHIRSDIYGRFLSHFLTLLFEFFCNFPTMFRGRRVLRETSSRSTRHVVAEHLCSAEHGLRNTVLENNDNSDWPRVVSHCHPQ